ncbi:MAG: hypothetical protein ACFFF4_13815 [Candidatus Thorarchaeota archaeon]
MKQSTTTFRTLLDDITESLNLAWSNMLSYFLANLGMAVLAVVMLAIIAIPLVAIAILAGPTALAAWATSLYSWSTANLFAAGSLAFMVILVPFIAFGFIFVGAVYGMSKEVVETGETKAESAFSWLRHNALSFAGVGVVLSLIILAPQMLVASIVGYLYGWHITGLANIGLSIFFFVYSFITLGLTSMVLPAVVNGKGVQEAVKESFRLATERFDRVFGIHTAIVSLGLLLLAPILIGALAAYLGYSLTVLIPYMIFAGLWLVSGLIFAVFLFLPMTYIAYTRVYHDLTGGIIADSTPQTPEIPMV